MIPKRLEKFGRVRIDTLLLAERPNRPQGHRLSRGRERLHRRHDGPHQGLPKGLFTTRSSAGSSRPTRRRRSSTTATTTTRRFETGKQYPILGPQERIARGRRGGLARRERAGRRGTAISRWAPGRSARTTACSRSRSTPAAAIFYTIRVKDLTTGKLLDDTIADVTANLAWANDSRTLFYTKQDPKTLRLSGLPPHASVSPPADDPLVYEEADETFSCRISRTKSDRYLMIASRQTLSTEYRFLDADKPDGAFRVIQPGDARPGVLGRSPRRPFLHPDQPRRQEFPADEGPDPVTRPGALAGSRPPPTPTCSWRGFELFRDFLVLEERRDGLIAAPRPPLVGRARAPGRFRRAGLHWPGSARIHEIEHRTISDSSTHR